MLLVHVLVHVLVLVLVLLLLLLLLLVLVLVTRNHGSPETMDTESISLGRA